MGDERLLAAMLGQLIWLALALAGAAWLGGPLSERLGLVPSRLPWRWVVVALVGFLCLSAAADAGLRTLALREGGRLGEIDELVRDTRAALAASLVALGLLPALCEELLFRGFALRALEGRFATWVAVTGSSVLFGLAHADLVHGGAAFVLGLYLGVVAVWAGSVVPAILCHAANNLYGIAALAGLAPPGEPLDAVGAWGLLVASGVCLTLLRAVRKRPLPVGNELQREAESADS
ncbi:MAG: hypothetical protein CL910_11585 [Deltaproteobacteria bacterium]|jgi:membrane protease YdiL (CAAX protease family)|nr:hypothetical protein [Deltaproteobacteria bacterium]